MAKLKADVICKTVNGHKLTITRIGGRCYFRCPSWPALAAQHEGCADSGPLVAEFEKRALAGTQPTLFVQEVVE